MQHHAHTAGHKRPSTDGSETGRSSHASRSLHTAQHQNQGHQGSSNLLEHVVGGVGGSTHSGGLYAKLMVSAKSVERELPIQMGAATAAGATADATAGATAGGATAGGPAADSVCADSSGRGSQAGPTAPTTTPTDKAADKPSPTVPTAIGAKGWRPPNPVPISPFALAARSGSSGGSFDDLSSSPAASVLASSPKPSPWGAFGAKAKGLQQRLSGPNMPLLFGAPKGTKPTALQVRGHDVIVVHIGFAFGFSFVSEQARRNWYGSLVIHGAELGRFQL